MKKGKFPLCIIINRVQGKFTFSIFLTKGKEEYPIINLILSTFPFKTLYRLMRNCFQIQMKILKIMQAGGLGVGVFLEILN